VGQEKLGDKNPDIIKAVGIFGGGISGTGGVCGAMLGGMACISSQCSRGELSDEESPRLFKIGHMMDQAFTEITAEFGGKDCADIARVDWLDRESVKEFYEGPASRKKYCQQVVGETARALGEIIEKELQQDEH
jgi:C_GCAxxG_C_C family probable redox protein|tara:strand:- start:320 stop:721 length:402 start_codon:yes stop_codon:yes gene_type:complete